MSQIEDYDDKKDYIANVQVVEAGDGDEDVRVRAGLL